MGKISIRQAADVPVRLASETRTPERVARYGPGEMNSKAQRYYPDDGETLNFFRVELGPNDEIQPHAHTAAEVIYLLSGEIHLGSQIAKPGAAIFVDEYTLYSFRAGPDGCSFLNFRGVPEVGYLTKDEFMAHRAANAQR